MREHGQWGVLAVASFLASRIVAGTLSNPTVVDSNLPLVAIALALLLWMLREAPLSSSLVVAVPILVIGCPFIPETSIRLAFYGFIVSVTVLLLVESALSVGSLGRNRAACALLVLLAPVRLIGLPNSYVFGGVLAIAGAAYLVRALSKEHVSATSFALALAVGLVTPVSPWRASLFPFVVVAALHLLGSRWNRTWIPAIAMMLLAGRWAVLIGVIVVAARFTQRVKLPNGLPLLAPFRTAGSRGTLAVSRIFLFSPELFARALRQNRSTALAVLALLTVSLFLRPQIAGLAGLTAACIAFAAPGNDQRPTTVALSPVVMAALMLFLWPWSGILPAAFPLPLAIRSLIALAFVTTVPALMANRRAFASVTALILFCACVALSVMNASGNSQTIGLALAAGQSDNIRPDQKGTKISMTLSGAHVSGMSDRTILGAIDAVDIRGGVYRRAVTVGELADWAAMRPDGSFHSRNPLPVDPAGDIQGLGAGAWLTGKGRVLIQTDQKISMLRVTADRQLPPEARLQVESIEVRD